MFEGSDSGPPPLSNSQLSSIAIKKRGAPGARRGMDSYGGMSNRANPGNGTRGGPSRADLVRMQRDQERIMDLQKQVYADKQLLETNSSDLRRQREQVLQHKRFIDEERKDLMGQRGQLKRTRDQYMLEKKKVEAQIKSMERKKQAQSGIRIKSGDFEGEGGRLGVLLHQACSQEDDLNHRIDIIAGERARLRNAMEKMDQDRQESIRMKRKLETEQKAMVSQNLKLKETFKILSQRNNELNVIDQNLARLRIDKQGQIDLKEQLTSQRQQVREEVLRLNGERGELSDLNKKVDLDRQHLYQRLDRLKREQANMMEETTEADNGIKSQKIKKGKLDDVRRDKRASTTDKQNLERLRSQVQHDKGRLGIDRGKLTADRDAIRQLHDRLDDQRDDDVYSARMRVETDGTPANIGHSLGYNPLTDMGGKYSGGNDPLDVLDFDDDGFN